MENLSLVKARTRKMWTEDEASEAAGVSKKTYRRWEAGECVPSMTTLRELCHAFGEQDPEQLGYIVERNRILLKPPEKSSPVTHSPEVVAPSGSDRPMSAMLSTPTTADIPAATFFWLIVTHYPEFYTFAQQLQETIHNSAAPLPFESSLDLIDAIYERKVSSSSSAANDEDIMENDHYSEEEPAYTNGEGEEMDKGRRNLTQQGIGLVGASALLPTIGQQDLIAEVRVALYPSGPTDKELGYLEGKIRYYWLDRQNASVAPNDLVLLVRAYVQKVVSLLRCSLLPSMRTRLCACLSQGMLLIGVCCYDAGQFQAARVYYQTAVDAAYEADHPILQALAWVWDSYSWMRSNETGRYERALESVIKAYGFASSGLDLAVLCNVQEASAEVYAYLNEKGACLDALKSIATLAGSGSGDWHYVHQFDLSKLYAIQGICLQQFYKPGVADTYPLLEDAKQALKEALSQPNVLAVRRAFHIVDLAQVHAREGEVEVACDYAKQIISLASTKAPIRQRLWTVRTYLEPYADVEAVKDLDREIRSLLLLG